MHSCTTLYTHLWILTILRWNLQLHRQWSSTKNFPHIKSIFLYFFCLLKNGIWQTLLPHSFSRISLSWANAFVFCNNFWKSVNVEIVYFDTRGQNGWLAYCKCKNAAGLCCIFTRAVSESPVWPHVSNHIFLYKFMGTRVGSPFTDIENAP